MKRLWIIVALAVLLAGCTEATPPANVEVVTLEGTAYERGFQHGQRFSSKIRSFYTKLLTTSLFPYLNRERPDISSVLSEYAKERYDGGVFTYLLMLENALALAETLDPRFIDEMHGIADGAALPFEDILILNTFLDTLLGFRALTFFIRKIQAPAIQSVEFVGGLDADGVDNDDDGEVDEEGEGLVTAYDQSPHAIMTQVPTGAHIRIVLKDQALLAIPEGVDPSSIRIQLGTTLLEAGHESITTRDFVEDGVWLVEVTVQPPGGLPAGSVVSLQLNADDLALVEEPPPSHPRIMRAERFVFSTVGDDRPAHEIENIGDWDGFSQPASLAFAVRGTATQDGEPLLGHHFAMLDNDTSHKHTVLFVHKPAAGIPHAVLGWAGSIGGFSGMNTAGLAIGVTNSDTLDLPVTAEVVEHLFDAKLLGDGVPGPLITRELLSKCRTADEATELLRQTKRSYGWNLLFADSTGEIVAVESDADALGDGDGGVFPYTPDESQAGNLDPYGRRWSSLGPDDIRIGAHYRVNADDAFAEVLTYQVTPQRSWTTYYFRSLRGYFHLAQAMAGRLGRYDAAEAMATLQTPDLVDTRDSMVAAVFEPSRGVLHFAMGEVPATDADFVPFDLNAAVAQGAAQ